MKTFAISNIRVLGTLRYKDGRTEELNRVFIDLDNGMTISRSFASFLIELKNTVSLGIPQDATMEHSSIPNAIHLLKGGSVSGPIVVFKKGDPYEITETSSAVTRPDHPLYGKVSVGDTAHAQADGVRLEGENVNLTFEPDAMKYAIAAATRSHVADMLLAKLGGIKPVAKEANDEPKGNPEDKFINQTIAGENP